MVRALARLLLVVVIVVAAAAFFMGYRWGGGSTPATGRDAETQPAGAVGTGGGQADKSRERARAAGAAIGDTIAVGAERAAESLGEARLTATVKSKIALDDTLDGARIHVNTKDTRVTLTGTVIDEAQHGRALTLARETDGVARVVDQLSVGKR